MMETQVIDKRGDLYLVVGEDISSEENPAVKLQVCSRALARCSPVFEAMPFGGFAESQPAATLEQSSWVVHLPEDEPEYTLNFLEIIHGRPCGSGRHERADEQHKRDDDECIRHIFSIVWGCREIWWPACAPQLHSDMGT